MSQPVDLAGTRQADPNHTRPTWVRWRVVALLVAFSFLTWFNRESMAVAYVEHIKDQYDIQPVQMGLVYSAFFFAYMLCMTPGGWLIDRFGPRAALAVMGLGSALFVALTAVAGLPALAAAGLVLPALLVVRSLMGVLSAPIYPAASRVVARWLPRPRRAWANGLIQAAAAVGIACAFHAFGGLSDRVGWPNAFVICGAVTGLVALLWLLYAADAPERHRSVNPAELRVIDTGVERRVLEAVAAGPPPSRADAGWGPLWNRSLILLTLFYATVGYVEYLFFFWMQYYFEQVLHLGKEASRVNSVILVLAMGGGMVAGGWVSDWLAQHWRRGWGVVPALGMTAGAGFLVLGLLATQTVWIVLWLALALAAVGACEAPVWTAAVELGGRLGGTAAGVCNTGGNAGGLLAPALTPLVSGWVSRQWGLSEAAGWQWGIALGSVLGLLGACLWWWITPAEQSPTVTSPP
jgi:MFS family permease